MVVTHGTGVVDLNKGIVALVLSGLTTVSARPGFAGAICPLPPPGVDGREFPVRAATTRLAGGRRTARRVRSDRTPGAAR